MQTKTIFPLVLVLALWCSSFAINFPNFRVEVLTNDSPSIFILRIQNPEKKRLTIEISHKLIGTMADTTISSEYFYQRYSLNEAEDGQYKIKVGSGKEVVVKKIELNTVISRSVKVLE